MSARERFDAYAEAFEVAYDSDDWSDVADFFTEDASYEVVSAPALSGKVEGRDAVMLRFKAGLDGLDRRFPIKRRIEILEDEAEARDDYVRIPGRVHYEIPGAPELLLHMEEEAWFRGDRICRLVDNIPEAEAAKMVDHVAKYLA